MHEKLSYIEDFAKKEHVPILAKEKAPWLEQAIKKYRPKKILEIGCAIGYSTILLGHTGAQITCVDRDIRALAKAKEFCAYYNIDATFHFEDGIKFLEKNQDCFDLVFIDFEMKKYLQAFTMLKSRANIIIFDNISNPKCQDCKKEIRQYNTEFISIGDGLAITFLHE